MWRSRCFENVREKGARVSVKEKLSQMKAKSEQTKIGKLQNMTDEEFAEVVLEVAE